jgi:simple sugar transport system permease protein
MLGLIFDPLLMFAAILILGAFSGYLCERVGIVNIGIDGMMCIGALVFTIVSAPMFHISDMGPLGLLIALPITMVISSVTGFLHAFATIKLKTNHIISGTAINLIGIALATFLNNPLGMKLFGSSSLKSAFQSFLYIPAINVSGSSIIFFGLAIVICICLYFVMIKTKTGLRYRAIGENPNAVDAQGINVIKYQ